MSVSLRQKLYNMKYGQELRSSYNGWQQSVGQSMDSKSARRQQADSDRSCISVFTAECPDQSNGTWKCDSRTEEENESKRLISIAQVHNLFVDTRDTSQYGVLYSKKTGESKVFANEELGLVFKIHNPYAKRVLKDLHPADAIYEHIIHNILFPNTKYTFVGISEEYDEVRIILSQEFCMAQEIPSDKEISDCLCSMGLHPEDNYYFGNDYLSVTDVSSTSDNVLKDAAGNLFFIDPIIKLKKPAPIVIDWLLSDDCQMWNRPVLKTRSRKSWLFRLFDTLFTVRK